MTPTRFPSHLDQRSMPVLRLFGVRSVEDAYVDLDQTRLVARFGRVGATTPITNIVSWQIEGPWRWITAIGVRLSVRHHDLTFGGTPRGGVRLDFRERVPVGPVRIPALYVTAEDMVGLGAALAELGIPGRDLRKDQPSVHGS